MIFQVKNLFVYMFLAINSGVFCGAMSFAAKAPSDKIRAGYMAKTNLDIPEIMASTGMNYALVKFGYYGHPDRPREIEDIKKWSQVCSENDIAFVPVLNLWHKEEEWVRPANFLYSNGVQFKNTPCPQDGTFFYKSIHQRILRLAKLSKKMPIAGVAIDLEMYAAEISSFTNLCFCDRCFETFMGPAPAIAAKNREQYLRFTNQMGEYAKLAEDTIRKMARHTYDKVAQIAPNMLICFLDLDMPSNYNTGLAKGFGTEAHPVHIFTERTYSKGYDNYLKKTTKRLSGEGIHAKLIAGLWQKQFPPQNLAEQYYYCSKDSSGYWIYTLESLSNKSKHSLPFEKDKYWQAIRQANSELNKLRANSRYVSPLEVRSFTPPLQELDYQNLIFPKKPSHWLTSTVDAPHRSVSIRMAGVIFLKVAKNDEINFKLSYQNKGNAKANFLQAGLVSPKRIVLAKGKASFLNPLELKAVAPETGLYAIAIETNGNIATVTRNSHLYAIDAGNFVNLQKPHGIFNLYRSNPLVDGKLEFWVDSIGESVTVTFKDKKGNLLVSHDVVGRQQISFPSAKDKKTGIVKMHISPRPKTHYEDVRVRIVSGFEKLIYPFERNSDSNE